MARVPAGSSFLADRDRWRIDERSRELLHGLLGTRPSEGAVNFVERAVTDYLHDRNALAGGADQAEVRRELKRFQKGLCDVIRFLKEPADDEPASIDAANALLARHVEFDGLPAAPGEMLLRLARSFDAAAAAALVVKASKANDPARERLILQLWLACEAAGATPTIRGHQSGREDREEAEPWSPFVEFAFSVVVNVSDHIGEPAPLRNSGFPAAVRNAMKSREGKPKQNRK